MIYLIIAVWLLVGFVAGGFLTKTCELEHCSFISMTIATLLGFIAIFILFHDLKIGGYKGWGYFPKKEEKKLDFVNQKDFDFHKYANDLNFSNFCMELEDIRKELQLMQKCLVIEKVTEPEKIYFRKVKR